MSQSEFLKYTESEEFQNLLHRYENSRENDDTEYFDADDLMDIAEYYHIKDRLDLTRETTNYCQELFPDNIMPRLLNIRIKLLDDGDVQEARRMFDALPNKESNLECIYINADIMICEDQSGERADKYLHQVHERLKQDMLEGNSSPLIDAEEDEEDLIKMDFPLDAAMLFLEHGLPLLAEKWSRLVPEGIGADVYDYWDNLGRIALELGKYKEAEKYWNKALDLNSYSVQAWVQLCDALFHQSKFKEALQATEYALAIDRNSPDATMAQGNCYYALNMIDKTVKCFETFLKLCPNHPLGHMLLATVLICHRDADTAFEHIKKCVTNLDILNRQNQIEALRTYCSIAIKVGDLNEALAGCEKLCEMGVAEDDVELIRGGVMLEWGDPTAAHTHFGNAMKKSGNDVVTMTRIAIIFYDNGHPDVTYSMLQAMLTYTSKNELKYLPPEAYVFLAGACRKLGHQTAYMEYLQKAVELAPLDASSVLGEFFEPGTEPKDYVEMEKQGKAAPISPPKTKF
jgi:tetratricopeptide (TPR) repeat protein